MIGVQAFCCCPYCLESKRGLTYITEAHRTRVADRRVRYSMCSVVRAVNTHRRRSVESGNVKALGIRSFWFWVGLIHTRTMGELGVNLVVDPCLDFRLRWGVDVDGFWEIA